MQAVEFLQSLCAFYGSINSYQDEGAWSIQLGPGKQRDYQFKTVYRRGENLLFEWSNSTAQIYSVTGTSQGGRIQSPTTGSSQTSDVSTALREVAGITGGTSQLVPLLLLSLKQSFVEALDAASLSAISESTGLQVVTGKLKNGGTLELACDLEFVIRRSKLNLQGENSHNPVLNLISSSAAQLGTSVNYTSVSIGSL